jgi:hypothetical protein
MHIDIYSIQMTPQTNILMSLVIKYHCITINIYNYNMYFGILILLLLMAENSIVDLLCVDIYFTR